MNRQRHESPVGRGPRPQVLLALCAAGVVLFNFPLLMVWDTSATVFGLPLLPVALFVVWAGLIAILALVSEHIPRRSAGTRVLGEEHGATAPISASPVLSLADAASEPVTQPAPEPAPELATVAYGADAQSPLSGASGEGAQPVKARDVRDA